MAENETQDQADSEPQDQQDALPRSSEEEKSEKNPFAIIIALLIILLIIGIVLSAYFILFKKKSDDYFLSGLEDTEYITQYLNTKQSEDAIGKDSEPMFTKEHSHTVNLSDGKHMMRFSWKAKVYDATVIDYLQKRRFLIDDRVSSILSKLRAEDLRNRSGLELLKRDIFKEINLFFSEEFILNSETKDRTPVKEILVTELYIN